MRFSQITYARSFRPLLLIVLALLVALSGCGQEASEGTPSDVTSEDILDLADASSQDASDASGLPDDKLLSDYLRAQFEDLVENQGFPAIIVGVIEGDAARVYSFGELDSGAKPTSQTLFEIGSNTKPFTALLLADAVKSGEVSLDDPAQELLAEFEIPTRDSKVITLEMLATHYSGLPNEPTNIQPDDPANYFANYDVAKLETFLSSYSLPRDPGASYEYSNVGYGMLGYAMGEYAGGSYEQALKSRIIEPLGLSSTYPGVRDAPAERLAKGHNLVGDQTSYYDFQVLAGAGSMVSDIDDMLTYLRANMGQNSTPLYPAMQLAHQGRVDGPEGPNGPVQVGLGWMTLENPDNDIIWHNGQTGGFGSFVGFSADGNRGVVILSNISKTDIITPMGLMSVMEGDDPDIVELSIAELDEYIGRYELEPDFILTVYREETQLYMQATGQGAFPIFPSAKDEFFAKVGGISVSFERDSAEQIIALVLHQDGDRRAPLLD